VVQQLHEVLEIAIGMALHQWVVLRWVTAGRREEKRAGCAIGTACLYWLLSGPQFCKQPLAVCGELIYGRDVIEGPVEQDPNKSVHAMPPFSMGQVGQQAAHFCAACHIGVRASHGSLSKWGG